MAPKSPTKPYSFSKLLPIFSATSFSFSERTSAVRLSPGSTTWTEAQSRQNFQLVQKVVVPGWEGSKLLTHPLAEQAGGDPHHGGGQQFSSQNDPEWQTLKAWVLGETPKSD